MRHGRVYKTGDVILAQAQFTDTFEIKTRPAVVLFEEYGNIVVAGVTSNTEMEGIPLTRKEGAVKDSVIKINYIFTISDKMNYPALKGRGICKGSDFPLLHKIPAALRIGNVVLDYISCYIADGAEKFSRAPEVSLAKMPSKPRMLFH